MLKADRYRGARVVLFGLGLCLPTSILTLAQQESPSLLLVMSSVGILVVLVGVPFYAKAQWKNPAFWTRTVSLTVIVFLFLSLSAFPVWVDFKTYECLARQSETHVVLSKLGSWQRTILSEKGHYAKTIKELRDDVIEVHVTDALTKQVRTELWGLNRNISRGRIEPVNYTVFLSSHEVWRPDNSQTERVEINEIPPDLMPFASDDTFQIIAAAKVQSWKPLTLALWKLPYHRLDVWSVASGDRTHPKHLLQGCSDHLDDSHM